MSLSTVRTKIKTLMEAVTGIGTVYEYKRYVNDWETYKNLFIKSSKVNTWEVQRTTGSSDPYGGGSGREDRMHNFTVRGFYGIDDKLASEKTFQDLTDLVVNAFRNQPTLSGTANIVNFPITWTFSEGKLGDVLCHIVEINLSVSERTLF